ncbi:MAG TPA: glycoside hydrolase domain-containing protein [Actinoplanes sp.]|jgi:hypothetical protein
MIGTTRRAFITSVGAAGVGALTLGRSAYAAAVASGLDYSYGRPDPDVIKADGYRFVCRYVSYNTTGKNINKSEADSLRGAGISIVINWENVANDALKGYDTGVTHAREAQRQAIAVGMPATRPIYFSVDFDATEAQQSAINDYMDGVASVLGRGRTGAYGGYYVIKRLFDAGKITFGWQTYAWSGGQWDSRAQLRQVQNGITVDGEDCDRDEAEVADYGQWGGAVTPGRPDGASVTGDPYADLIAVRADGTMWLYPNNIVRDDGRPYADYRQIGHGWDNYPQIVPADVTGDGFTDLVAMRPDGTLWLYANNYMRDNGDAYSGYAQIGNGWDTFATIVSADITGDGYADLIGMRSTGELVLYPNTKNGATPYTAVSSYQIGTGWNNFTKLIAADVTGDGYTDLVALKADGTLWLYPNRYTTSHTTPFTGTSSYQIGSGWGNFSQIIGADVTGDGYTDLVGIEADGTMLLYQNGYQASPTRPFTGANSRQIGTGWVNYPRVLA